ncbi:MAG: hypothetical protein ACRD3N_17350 [Terracidiphilus sp.]
MKTYVVSLFDARLLSAVSLRASGSSSSHRLTSLVAFATSVFTRGNANLQAAENAYVNNRKRRYTNQYPVGDDVSQRKPDAVGSAGFGMLALGRISGPESMPPDAFVHNTNTDGSPVRSDIPDRKEAAQQQDAGKRKAEGV